MIANAFDDATREFTESSDYRELLAGRATVEVAREYLGNVFRTPVIAYRRALRSFFISCWLLLFTHGEAFSLAAPDLQGPNAHVRNLLVLEVAWIFNNWRTERFKEFFPKEGN
jgi:hypothetical protein